MRYLITTLRHKWFVFLAGLRLGGIPLWRLIAHDWHKLTPAELPHYHRQFYGDKGDPLGFAYAWLNHQNNGKHHWEYWIIRSDHSRGGSGAVNGCLPMPETYVREMVADWMGAARTYSISADVQPWLNKNYHKMRLHPCTVDRLEMVLAEIGVTLPASKPAWSLPDIVEQLRMCQFQCEAGSLENSVAFQALEEMARCK